MPTSCKYDPTIGGAALLAELDEHGGGITALWRDRYQERISFASFKYRVWAARNGKAVPAAARRIDAQPEYRDWLKEQDHQLELIEEAA